MKDLVDYYLEKNVSEAYNIIPNSVDEIDSLKNTAIDTKTIKSVYSYIFSKNSSLANPIAVSSSKKEKQIKVARDIADGFNLNSLSKKFGVKLTAGDGSRGRRGANNQGTGFEKDLVDDINLFIEEGIEAPSFKYPSLMNDLYKDILFKHKSIQVNLEGGANTKRPLEFTEIGAVIGGTAINVGHVVTDVTIIGDGTTYYYLSLKSSGTVTFFNCGVRKILTKEQFENGKITNKNGKAILDMFGINEKKFINIFQSYKGKTKKRIKKKTEDVTSKVNKRSLHRMLLTGIGYGYYMLHKRGKNVEYYKMDVTNLKKSVKVKKVVILWPDAGSAKRIDIQILTDKYVFKVNIRNKQGGLYPTHIMCDYKYVQ